MRRFALLITIVSFATGCSVATMDEANVPVSAAPLADAPEDEYDIPIDQLAEVMRFAMWELQWGPMKIEQESQGLTAAAVRPNGRTVQVRAQVNTEGLVQVQVLADRFGNEAIERDFHRELALAVERWRDRQATR